MEGQQALDGGTGPPSGRLSQCERAGGARQWSRAVSHRSGPGATSDSDPVEEVASERVTRVTRGEAWQGDVLSRPGELEGAATHAPPLQGVPPTADTVAARIFHLQRDLLQDRHRD